MPGTVYNYTFQLASENMMPLHISQLQETLYILHFVDGKSKDKLKKFILGGNETTMSVNSNRLLDLVAEY